MAGIDLAKIQRTKNKTKNQVEFTSIQTPKYLENEMSKFNSFMVKSMRKRFETKVLKAMSKNTIDKFQDAQVGNYAVVFNELFKEFTKSIDRQFSGDRIDLFVKKLFNQADSYNQARFYGNVSNTMGVDMEAILKTDGLNSFKNAKSIQSVDMLNKLKADTITAYKTNVLRRMSAGDSLADLYQEVKKQTGMRLNSGDLIARNELKNFNAELANKRAKNNGITKGVWVTAQDERVRDSHAKFNGKEFDIDKGLYNSTTKQWIKPSEEINCRCTTRYIVNFDEE
tara:strand:- start:50 stop:898 length:849 start_codon:yes stop_codon:yes gene_type:complete